MSKGIKRSVRYRKGVMQMLFLVGIITFLCLSGASIVSSSLFGSADSFNSTNPTNSSMLASFFNLIFSPISTLFSAESVYAGSSTMSTTNIYVTLTDGISIRTMDKDITEEIDVLSLGVTPSPSGTFIKNTTQVDVSTSNPSGYNLYMASSYVNPHTSSNTSGSDGSGGSDNGDNDGNGGSSSDPVYTTDMIHSDSNVSDVIANLSGNNVTESAFSAPNFISSGTNSNPYVNHWGYSLNAVTTNPANITAANSGSGSSSSSGVTVTDNADPSSIIYNPLPSHDNAILIRDDVTTNVEHSYTPVTIGANVDTNVVSGTYTNNLVFSTIVNPPYVDYSLHFIANTDKQGGDDGTVTNLPADIEQRVMATSYTITIPGSATTGGTGTNSGDSSGTGGSSSGSTVEGVPTRPGYVFDSYNTKPDGTGDTYHPGDSYTLVVEDKPSMQVEEAEGTLYAIWKVSYNVTYNCNSGSGCPDNFSMDVLDSTYSYTIPGGASASSTSPSTASSATSSTASSAIPTRTGYTFSNYLGSDGNTYAPGAIVTLTEGTKQSITLTAQWTVKNYTVSITTGSTTVNPTSLSISYGGSATVKVSPGTGYYLSSVTCPTGYTCTGYSTGTSATAEQTVTVTNNNTDSGGTLTFARTVRSFTVNVTANGTTVGANSLSIPYGGSATVTVSPGTGYYLNSVSCPTGYTCSGYSTGTSATGQQTVTVKNNNTVSGGTLSFGRAARSFTVSVTSGGTTVGATSLSIPYGGSKTVTVNPGTGYYLSSVSCPSGYTCSGYSTGTSAYGTTYTVTVKNNNTVSGGTLTFARKGRTFTATLNQQSGSGGTSSVTATYGSAMPAITKPSRTNYTFGGYYTSTGGGGTQYYTAAGASARAWNLTSNTTLYAKWTRNDITLIGGTIHSGWNLTSYAWEYMSWGVYQLNGYAWNDPTCNTTKSAITSSAYNVNDLNNLNVEHWVRGDDPAKANQNLSVYMCSSTSSCTRVINVTYTTEGGTSQTYWQTANISSYTGNYYIKIVATYTNLAGYNCPGQINIGTVTLTK